ncbi:MAG: type II toxin-antitoxin system VapB family antitoxin [Chloroflexi bacterium]|nr:type II toxin-antitoxin system VapB family antitoxin [Chloroflexota bacterium]
MRITLNIDEKILAEVIEATGEKSKSKAVNMALEQFIRQKKIKNLLSMVGKLEIDDTSEEQAKVDKERDERLELLWRGEN